jgi:hypothetical protein
MEGSAHAEVVRAEELHSNEAPQGASFLGVNTVAIGRLPNTSEVGGPIKRFAAPESPPMCSCGRDLDSTIARELWHRFRRRCCAKGS